MATVGTRVFTPPAMTTDIHAGHPFTSQIVGDIFNKTNSLAFKAGGSAVQYFCPSPRPYFWQEDSTNYNQTAAIAQFSDVKTWATFKFIYYDGNASANATVDFQLPYRMTESFHRVYGYATIVTDMKCQFRTRLYSTQMVDAVADTDGDASRTMTPLSRAKWGNWETLNQSGGNQFYTFTTGMSLVPTLPVSRRVAIGLEIYMDEENYPQGYMGYSVSDITSNIYLMSLSLFDDLTTPELEPAV
jgi:hypothetical protein